MEIAQSLLARFVRLAAITGYLLTMVLAPPVSAAGSFTSAATSTVCALSIPSPTTPELQRDQEIVAGRLIALGAARSTVTYSGNNCLAVTMRGVRHPRATLNAAIRVGYVADADSGTYSLWPGTRVTLVCRKSGCAPDLPVGKTVFHSGARPILQIVVPMKFLQRGSARVSTDSSGRAAIDYSIVGKGSGRWCRFTTRHMNHYVAIVLDGTVLSDPIIQQPICGGQTQITGFASKKQAREIVAYINTGPLPVPLNVQT